MMFTIKMNKVKDVTSVVLATAAITALILPSSSAFFPLTLRTTMRVTGVESTPNPCSFKFDLDHSSLAHKGSKGITYTSRNSADAPGEIKDLIELEGVDSVYALGDWLCLNKKPSAKWNTIVRPSAPSRLFFASGTIILICVFSSKYFVLERPTVPPQRGKARSGKTRSCYEPLYLRVPILDRNQANQRSKDHLVLSTLTFLLVPVPCSWIPALLSCTELQCKGTVVGQFLHTSSILYLKLYQCN